MSSWRRRQWWSLLSGQTWKKPIPDMVANDLDPLVVNLLPVGCSHARIDMAHDVIHGHLVTGATTDGFCRVAQDVERAPPLEVETTQHLGEFLSHRVDLYGPVAANEAPAVLGDE